MLMTLVKEPASTAAQRLALAGVAMIAIAAATKGRARVAPPLSVTLGSAGAVLLVLAVVIMMAVSESEGATT